jgi:4'-phosphopantetheinyl transferase
MVWVVPATPPPLGVHEAHLWRLDLDAADGEAVATDILNEEERARAARFHFERDRHRFIAARAALRRILAAYLDRAPADLVFSLGRHGKPALENLGLEFNLSHSSGCGLLAVTRGRRVGVDVERVRADFAGEDIARRFFASAEVEVLAAAKPDEYVTAFFRCWTRKEAYVKARGGGLSLALDRFEVPLERGATRAIVSCLDDPSECSLWSLREIVPAPGYLGALVVEGDGWALRTYA